MSIIKLYTLSAIAGTITGVFIMIVCPFLKAQYDATVIRSYEMIQQEAVTQYKDCMEINFYIECGKILDGVK